MYYRCFLKEITARIVPAVLAVCLFMSSIVAFGEDYKGEISETEKEIESSKEELLGVQDSIKKNQELLTDLSSRLAALESEKLSQMTDSQITAEELKFLKQSIENYDAEIEALQAEHDELETKMLERARIMYQSSSNFELIQLFFSSKNIFDFIEKIDIYNKMLEEDKALMKELKESEANLSEKRAQEKELFADKETLLAELDEAIALLENNEELIGSNYTSVAALLVSLEEQEQGYFDVIDELAEELNELEEKQAAAEEAARKAEEERLRKEAEAKAAAEAAEKARLEAEAKAAAEAAEKAKKEAEEAAAAKKAAEEKAKEISNPTPAASEAHFCWPIASYYGITSKFGYRIHPINKKYSLHTGVDLGAAAGTAIYAAQDGTVVMSGTNGGFGYCVIIDHGNGLRTLYGHCSKLLVSVGQTVKRGQTIALVGMTGSATGNHLHFEVQLNGTPVEPLQYIN